MAIIGLLIGRAGSSGIKEKNLYPVLGRPLMAYPLIAAKSSRYVDQVFVSTDCEMMMRVGKDYGAEIINRPRELATNGALAEDAYLHGYREIHNRLEREGEKIEFMVLLLANAATVTCGLIDQGIEMLRSDSRLDSAVTVSKYNMYSPIRTRRIGEDGCLEPAVPSEAWGDTKTISCDRNSQGDIYIADLGAVIVRSRCLEQINEGQLPQKWMGKKIAPIHSWGGCDVDYEWQIPQVEYWLIKNGFTQSNESAQSRIGKIPISS